MQRMKVAWALLVVSLAVGAATASAASAAKLPLSEGGVALTPGSSFYAYAFNGYVHVSTSEGAIECSSLEAELELGVVTNSNTRDELEIKHLQEHQDESCRSFTGNSEVLLDSLGSFLTLNAEGKAVAGLYPTFRLVFEHEEYEGVRYEDIQCVYRRERLRGTNTATPSRQALEFGLEGTMGLHASLSSPKARHLCPAEAELSISFPFLEGATGATIEEQTST